MSGEKIGSVLFVCLGNICRSPVAEAVFRSEVAQRGLSEKWEIDSAATASWHVGRRPDSRSLAVLAKHNITTNHHGRQVKKEDFHNYDLILGMDHDNMKELRARQPPGSRAHLMLLGEFDPQKNLVVEDPYYGSEEDFESVYEQCVRCCKSLIEKFPAVVKKPDQTSGRP